jgi:hypothetical protein
MKTFSINIAKAYTQSDWRGLPAHMHHAIVTLDYGMSEIEAVAELRRLETAYPWPEFHMTLRAVEISRLKNCIRPHPWISLRRTNGTT